MQVTGSRPKIVAAADGRGVVGHAGTRLLADVADATGLTGAFSDALAGSRIRQSGHDPGRVAVDLALMLAHLTSWPSGTPDWPPPAPARPARHAATNNWPNSDVGSQR
jgi:hypothetical protein